MLTKLVQAASVVGLFWILTLLTYPWYIGARCDDADLRTVQALGCGQWRGETWSSCYASNQSGVWFCNSQEVPLNGTWCTGSEMCPGASCYGPKNGYCYSGWNHSGKQCSTTTVTPCCTITSQCATVWDSDTIWPSWICGCESVGAWPMGSGTIATYGAACGGGGGTPPTTSPSEEV